MADYTNIEKQYNIKISAEETFELRVNGEIVIAESVIEGKEAFITLMYQEKIKNP